MFDDYYYDNYYDGNYDEDPEKMHYDNLDKINEKSDLFEANTSHLPEDAWLDGKKLFDCDLILKHKFHDQNYDNSLELDIVFGLETSKDESHTKLNFLTLDKLSNENFWNEDFTIKGDIEHTKYIVNNIIKFFDKEQDISAKEIAKYIDMRQYSLNWEMETIQETTQVQNYNKENIVLENKPLFKLTPEQVAYIKYSANDRKMGEAAFCGIEGIPHIHFIPHTFGKQNKQKSLFIFEEYDFKNYKNGMSNGFTNVSFYPDVKKDYHIDYCVSDTFYEKQKIVPIAIQRVERIIEDLDKENNINMIQVKDYLDQKLIPPVPNRQLETAQKTGYVQGVCESVLAFNTDENRKIMSEDTMSFLSKKILSEMHVTKDMAQKFANPETYKALEQFVFAPKQEQRLEQTQSQGRSI